MWLLFCVTKSKVYAPLHCADMTKTELNRALVGMALVFKSKTGFVDIQSTFPTPPHSNYHIIHT